jgi:predicted MPP superfamily phosphohydrolase
MRLAVVLILAYLGARLLVPFTWPVELAGAALIVGLYFLLPSGWRPRRRGNAWAFATWVTMGFLSWLLVLTLARDLLMLAASFLVPAANLEEWSRISSLTVIVATFAITWIGFFMARRVAPVVKVDVPVTDLPEALEGFTIAQISDIHVGPTIKRPFVEKMVERVNRLDADVIAITGDIVDGSVRELSHDTAPLAHLSARHGIYAVTGNHEYYSGANAWVSELERLGTHVLMNEHVVIEKDGAALALAGVTDYSAGYFEPSQKSDPQRAVSGAPRNAVKILLAHQPRSAKAAVKAGYDLQLSGHTHGGQFWPWNFFVRLQQPFTAGLNRLGKMWVYINRGTGYWGPPMRFGIPSEITRIRLVRAGP